MLPELDLEKIYEMYYMKIYSFALTIIKNASVAEDVTQETFVKAMNSTYRGESSEYTWLCSIAKNLCMDYMRKQKHVVTMPEEETATDVSIEKELLDEMTSLHIHQILHQLEEPYKEVFNLRVFGELSFLSIAQIFGKSESWARVTYHRARLKIQERM